MAPLEARLPLRIRLLSGVDSSMQHPGRARDLKFRGSGCVVSPLPDIPAGPNRDERHDQARILSGRMILTNEFNPS